MTAGLAGFEWLSGCHPDPEESKILLKKTAVASVHSFEDPRKNGHGVLNSYKLGAVGTNLKKKCEGRPASCCWREIRNDENYQFPEDSSLKKALREAFPGCSSEERRGEGAAAGCDQKKAAFKRLRQAAFLNPQRRELWESLSCIYKEAGFSANADAYSRFALAAGSKEEALKGMKDLMREGKISNGDIRALSRMGGEGEEILKELSATYDGAEQLKGAKSDLYMFCIDGTSQISGEALLKIMDNFSQDPDPHLRALSLRCPLRGKHFPLALRMARDESARVRIEAVHSLKDSYGGLSEAEKTQALSTIKSLANDESAEIRREILYTVIKWGDTGFARRFLEDPDEKVQADARTLLK